MTSFNQRYPLRYHISTFDRYCLIIQIISLIPFIYGTICLFSTLDGYCLIIQIINHIPFIYFAIYARFSVNMVNPYGGQYIVLSSIGMHNHCVKALLLANIVYLYILNPKGCLCNIGNIYQLKLLGTSIPCIFLYFHTKCEM